MSLPCLSCTSIFNCTGTDLYDLEDIGTFKSNSSWSANTSSMSSPFRSSPYSMNSCMYAGELSRIHVAGYGGLASSAFSP